MSKNNNIEMQIKKACENNKIFNRFLALCEEAVENWIDKINLENDAPSINPKRRREPCFTRISVLLPVVPISPSETSLLLDYLGQKYIQNYHKGEERCVGGDYFRLRKCFFKNNYKLSTHYDDCDI